MPAHTPVLAGRPAALAVAFLLLVTLGLPALGAEDEGSEPRLTEMSLEELMSIEVTSVSRRAEPLSEAAAAAFVLTQDEIRRSGYTTIADLLRLVPGMLSAQIDANKWAVSARGFNGQFANKLLVLVDGRSVYTPLFAGVYWDVQDLMIEDIERIEVIRGPGATLWGANAVNGVINIITTDAADSEGLLVSGGGGNVERGFGAARFARRLSARTSVRVYGKYFDRAGSVDSLGEAQPDDWTSGRGGFRLDWQSETTDHITVQGDLYEGKVGVVYPFPSSQPPYQVRIEDVTEVAGGNLLTRWSRSLSPTADWALQLYFDRTERSDVFFSENRTTLDADFQHSFSLRGNAHMLWGIGYRRSEWDFEGTEYAATKDGLEEGSEGHLSGFVQGDWSTARERLRLTLGCKAEHKSNQAGLDRDLTEIQPNGRLLWRPNDHHALWASIARAVRTPTQVEMAGEVWLGYVPAGVPENPGPVPLMITLVGTEDYVSEELLAYELGYRCQPRDGLTFDLAVFYNDYENLRGMKQGEVEVRMDPQPHAFLPVILSNAQRGQAYGAELATGWQMLERLRLRASYSFWEMDLRPEVENLYDMGFAEDTTYPPHQVSLRASADLAENVDLDLIGRFVDELSGLAIDAYTELDARLAWRPVSGLEIAVTGRNLLEGQHQEHVSELNLTGTELERGVYVSASWRH